MSGLHQTFWEINKKSSFPEQYLRDVTPFIFKFKPQKWSWQLPSPLFSIRHSLNNVIK